MKTGAKCRYCGGGMHSDVAMLHHENACLKNPANFQRVIPHSGSGNRQEIVVNACGDPGSWARSVQINPQIALTALALLEAFYHGNAGAAVIEETRQYLIACKRIEA